MLARGVHARVAAAVAGLLVLVALSAAPPSYAAPAAPTGLAPGAGDVVAASPVLSWDRSAGATGYDVEVSAAPDFATKLYTTSTVNRRATPTSQLPMSDLYWRVRAKGADGTGSWATVSFTRSRLAGPVLRGPADGDVLDQPDEPPVLTWDPVPGAIGYTVEADRGPDADWVDSITGTTKSTSYTAIAIATGDWAWRVTATLAAGQLTHPSASRTFTVGDLAGVTVTGPADGQDVEDVELDWEPVAGALRYEVRVSTDDQFASTNIVDSRFVKGTRYSPAMTYDVDDYWWQVRAIDPLRVAVPWSAIPIHSFTRTWDPLPTTPGHGTDPNPQPDLDGAPRLVHPADTLTPAVTGDMYFQWTPVRHATRYRLDVGTDLAFSPGTFKSCITPHTTYTPDEVSAVKCLPGLNTPTYWRVKALDGPAEVQGYYSAIGRFRYSRPQVPLTAPAAGAAVGVPTLRWQPVAGAEKYAVQVVSHAGTTVEESTYSTSWTPPVALDPAEGPFQWTVQALDRQGIATPLVIGAGRTFTLTGAVPDSPASPLTPLDQDAPPTYRLPALRWEPAPGAATYRLWIGTAGTNTFSAVDGDYPYPAATDPGAEHLAGGDYDWFVQAFDAEDHLLGQGSRGHFTVLDPDVVSGQQVALQGTTLDSGAACLYGLQDLPVARVCPTTAGTPVLDWQPSQEAAFYLVYVARDRNFQNMVYGAYSDPKTLPWTINTRWTRTETLPESQAGTAYYWFIRPCKAKNVCAADPLRAEHAFEKRSPQVVSDPVADTADDITFTWDDYLATNKAAAPHPVTGERSDQEASVYQLQVSLTDGFDRIIDDVEVDQPTYTAFSRLYPEGNLYWRVRAYDGDDRALPWTETRNLLKTSPRPAAIAPTGTVPLTEAFRWSPVPFAVSYDVEAYKNADTTASTVNRVVDERVDLAAFAPGTPLPTGDYVWRVRRVDDSGNPGAWSDWASYRIDGSAPLLGLPEADAAVAPAEALFTWQSVPGATTYRFERREMPSGTVKETVTTASLSWAPTTSLTSGAWQWRVTSLDAAGAAIKASAWRSFSVQAGPTATTPPVVTGSGSLGELLHVTAPTWDVPDVVTSYQWLRGGTAIAGGTGIDHEVVAADVGRSISVRATATLAGYGSTTAVSNAVTGVLGAAPPVAAPPTLSGSGRVGEQLTATLPAWRQTGVTTTYRWLRDGAAAGATGSLTFTPRESDLGRSITFEVTGRLAGYSNAVVTTSAVVVVAGAAPHTSVSPAISGRPKVGQSLKVSGGSWPTGFRLTYQWLRNGKALAGATSSAYRPVASDSARALSVRVTATKTGYDTGTATTRSVKIARMTSTTKLTLSSSTLATVSVKVTGWARPTGRVRIFDGRKVVGKARLTSTGLAKVRLKRLKKGTHRLVARYDGATVATKSVSPRLVLKVR